MTKTLTIPAVGSRVGFIDGPGVRASDRAGVVLAHETNRWGTRAVVMMDDCSFKYVHSVTTVGIGCYVL